MIYSLYDNDIELEFNVSSHRYKVNGSYVQGVTTILGSVTDKSNLINWSANLASELFRDRIQALVAGGKTITSDELETIYEDARRAHTVRKEAGGDVGTQAHNIIENYIANGAPLSSTDKKVAKVLKGFEKFLAEYNPKFIASEQLCYSKKYNYAGTYDAVIEINGKTYMADWKTADPMGVYRGSKHTGQFKAYPQHFYQCAAYDLAYCDEAIYVNTINADPDTFKKFDGHAVIYITKSGKCYPYFSYDTTKNKETFVGGLKMARRNKELTDFESLTI